MTLRGDLRERVLTSAAYLRAEDLGEWTAVSLAEVMTGGAGHTIDQAVLERVLHTLVLDGVLEEPSHGVYRLAPRA